MVDYGRQLTRCRREGRVSQVRARCTSQSSTLTPLKLLYLANYLDIHSYAGQICLFGFQRYSVHQQDIMEPYDDGIISRLPLFVR